MNELLVIDAARILTPAEEFAPGRVIVREDSIEAVGRSSDVTIPTDAIRLDATRLTMAPGFIDPHIHGGGGVDVMAGEYDALNTVSRIAARHGTTAFLPTTVSSPPDILGPVLERIGGLVEKRFDGAQPVGIHLEGPFINPARRGVHRPESILSPSDGLLQDWINRSARHIRLITIAPEIEGAEAVIRAAGAQNIQVAMGHSNATYDEAQAAVRNGIRYAVHTFNAMREFRHRDPGIVGAALADDRVFAEIIADGIHVSPEVVRIFARSKRRDRILLVTDAISATDMPDGSHVLGSDRVTVSRGVCRDTEGRLAGSTLTQDAALRNLINWTDMSLQEALFGVTCNPATALQLERRGRIEPGARADLVMLDDGLRVMKTFVGGKLVFER